jgi:hypothetical protein
VGEEVENMSLKDPAHYQKKMSKFIAESIHTLEKKTIFPSFGDFTIRIWARCSDLNRPIFS